MIKAIPTRYNDTLFRSLLEARYAKALDNYGIEWVYEIQGYEYGGIRYLPDFYLPSMNMLLEIKGPSIPGIEKPINLMKLIESGHNVKANWWNPEILILICDAKGNMILAGEDEKAVLAKCRECHKYFLLIETRSFRCRLCGAYDGDHHLEALIDQLTLPQKV